MKKELFPKEILENTVEVHQFQYSKRSQAIFFFFLLLTLNKNFSQQKNIFEGDLCVENIEDSIPFAHFQSPYGGFISDNKGRFHFEVNASIDSLKVFISAIGYARKEVYLFNTRNNKIHLQPAEVSLDEVVIDYEDPAIGLIKKVIANIPENYPNEFEQLYGEHNENTYSDSLKTKPIYKFNGKIRADKFSYQRKNTLGNIELIDKNVETYDLDSLNVRFYGGGHMVHHRDFVMSRKNFLTKSKIDQFELKITDTLVYNNINVAALSFKNKVVKGTAYIDLQSYALVRVERFIDPAIIRDPLGLLKIHRRTYVHEIIDYAKHKDEKWRINFIHYRTGFKLKTNEKEIHLDDTFILEKAEEGTVIIPENKRILYTDVLLNKIDLDSFTKPNKKEKFYRFLSRFRFSTSFFMIPFSVNQHQLFSSEFGLNKTEIARKEPILALDFHYDFKIKNNWGLRFLNGSSLRKKQFENYSFGVWKESEINLNGRWKYGLSTSIDYRKLRINHGEVVLGETVFYKDKKFDSGLIEYFSEQRDFGCSSKINLIYQIKGSTTLGVYINYFHPLIHQQGLYVEEKKEFWFWNRSRLFDKNALTSSQSKIIENNLQLGLNLMFKF